MRALFSAAVFGIIDVDVADADFTDVKFALFGELFGKVIVCLRVANCSLSSTFIHATITNCSNAFTAEPEWVNCSDLVHCSAFIMVCSRSA